MCSIGVEKRREESGPARGARAPTQLVEDEEALAWEASPEGMCAVRWARSAAAAATAPSAMASARGARAGRTR